MFCVLALALLFRPSPQLLAKSEQANTQSEHPKPSILKYAGTWEGKCQDGRTFVVLALRAEGDHLAGTVSIGNMHGDDEGACMLVTAPPAPEHALKVGEAVAHNDVLSFAGSQSSDSKLVRFEFKEIDQNKADLKLLNTPVEQHPWALERVQRPD
jgi:hypothetical protein